MKVFFALFVLSIFCSKLGHDVLVGEGVEFDEGNPPILVFALGLLRLLCFNAGLVHQESSVQNNESNGEK